MSAQENLQVTGTKEQSRLQVASLISRIALPILVIVILYLLISGHLLSRSPFVIAGQVLAVGLSVLARRSFQAGQFSIQAEPKEGELLEKGPYKFIRHPMYASALLLLWSSILGHASLVNLVIGLVMTGILAIRMATEEGYLRARYPVYVEYARRTKRIIPFVI
jgi:protein-S-isoprenylcysteine O-methyltransferase Ste14